MRGFTTFLFVCVFGFVGLTAPQAQAWDLDETLEHFSDAIDDLCDDAEDRADDAADDLIEGIIDCIHKLKKKYKKNDKKLAKALMKFCDCNADCFIEYANDSKNNCKKFFEGFCEALDCSLIEAKKEDGGVHDFLDEAEGDIERAIFKIFYLCTGLEFFFRLLRTPV